LPLIGTAASANATNRGTVRNSPGTAPGDAARRRAGLRL